VTYVPHRGDVVWIDLSPTVGHEQGGHRPLLVLSPVAYNERTDLLLGCPITSRVKGYIFEVPVPAGMSVRGVVLADQIRCVDWRFRRVQFIGKLPQPLVEAVQNEVEALIRS